MFNCKVTPSSVVLLFGNLFDI